jgi:3'-phosphoadenosine 5'-phosphosulfate sulfotransferase (PAPS reductase)/FAD synthetase
MIQVSFSGGRSSAMMAKIMIDNYPKDELIFTFANTGKELPETLDFVNDCDKNWNLNVVWIEYCPINKFKVVDYESASSDGLPFEQVIDMKQYLPNRVTRFCTTELKIKPMSLYLQSLGYKHWDTAVGIRKDEPNRYHKMKNKVKKDRWDYIFPLWDFNATKESVVKFWSEQSFDLKIHSEHSNCDFCFLKGTKKKVAQAHLMPERLQWWIDMETKIGKRFHSDFPMTTLKQLALNPQLFDEPNIDCFCGD